MNTITFHPEKSSIGSANALSVLRVAFAWSGFGTRVFQFSGSDDQNYPWLNNPKPGGGGGSNSKGPRKNRDDFSLATVIVLGLIFFIIGGALGLALYRARNLTTPTEEWTSISTIEHKLTCQELIDRAMQASDDSCNLMGPNYVCYGNNTLLAELIAGTAAQFSQRGNMVNVADLKRLAASPLSLAGEEWGIAVFKVMANLPRSLPGETITMVAFGNTTLDNPSDNMHTFYFSSALGQIECDQVPFDGLMITMPDGAGVSLAINDTEMTLMGNASITATQNGSMEVSMYSGSAYVASNGQSQIVTAGQSTSISLGGPDGTSAISPPSAPEPLSPEELTLACTMTGEFCSQQEITPVNPLDALATFEANLGTLLPTNAATPSFTLTPALNGTPRPTPLTTASTAIKICHCTTANSCQELNVQSGSGGHWDHPYDIIPAPSGGCGLPPEPTQEPTPKPTREPQPEKTTGKPTSSKP